MKIIQLSDIHIPNKGESTHNIPVLENFEKVFAHIKKQEFDALVVSGDLAYHKGSDEIYMYVRSRLQELHKPAYVIAGNHDVKHLMYDILRDYMPSKKYYYEQRIFNHNIIFLNTGKGTIGQAQLKWLYQRLQNQKQCIVFMHHPPINTGVVYMDNNHALKNQHVIMDVLHAHPYPIHVFCGHYHVAQKISSKNVTITVCPSAYYQIDALSKRFAIGSNRVGYRSILVEDDTITSEEVWV